MKKLLVLWSLVLELWAVAAVPLEVPGNAAAVRAAIKAQAEPWGMPGCVAAWDWRDVSLNGVRVVQWNDKTGNGRHLTHATDSTRGVLTTAGVWTRGGAYTIGNGGVTNIDTQSWSFVWVGRDFMEEDPNTGMTGNSGYIYAITGSNKPLFQWGGAYHTSQNFTGEPYAPGPVFAPAGKPTIVGQSFGTAATTYYANGSVGTRLAFAASTGNTLTKLFGYPTDVQFSYKPTYACLVFNRSLSVAEMAYIGAYYGCPTSPGGTMVYCFGSSTPNGQGAGQTQLGCIQQFCDWIGASRNISSIGGAGWNGTADTLQTAGVCNVYRGYRNIHILFPQHNDLAAHVSVATCLTKVQDVITKVRSVDPVASFILCPTTPRSASFSGGQTADDFDVDRLAFNSGMSDMASAQPGVVYADAMTIAGMSAKADAAVGPLMHADGIHMTAAGHLAYAKSLYRAYLALFADEM